MSRPQWWVGVCDKDTTSQATGAVTAYRVARRVDRTGMPSTSSTYTNTNTPPRHCRGGVFAYLDGFTGQYLARTQRTPATRRYAPDSIPHGPIRGGGR